MLNVDAFKSDGLEIIDDHVNPVLRFTRNNGEIIGSAGAFTVINAPAGILKNQSYSLKVRLQIRNLSAKLLRVRFESGGTISNAWIDFSGSTGSSRCDNGLEVWFVNQEIALVDAYLQGLVNDNVRFSFHLIEGFPDSVACSFILENISFKYDIGGFVVNRPVSHSVGHAGKALELCKGIGIEIGALHMPLPLDACVIRVDRFSTNDLKRLYLKSEELSISQIRQVQVVSKDAYYPFFDDNAFDFVVNSHVLEHVCNPGRQIMEWLRILQPGGVLYMIVPDKNYCFDRKRLLTPIEHLMHEFEDDVREVTLDHYCDYIINTSGEQGYDCSNEFINQCYEAQSSIHVHTFDPTSLRNFIDQLAPKLNAVPIHYEFHELNMHCALRKL